MHFNPAKPLVNLSIAVFCMFSALPVLAQQKFKAIPLTVGMHVIQAEVAATESEREQGLMYREKLGPNEGMVFLFEGTAQVCMWKKNTLITKTVDYIDEEEKIVFFVF